MSYIGNSIINGTFRSEFFSGDGATTAYTLAYGTGNEASVIVTVSGVKQATNTYALSNGQLVFTEAPPTGTQNIEIVYMGDRVQVNPYLSADTYGIVRINSNVLSENVSITTGYNASSAGPLTIADGKTVTIANSSTWTIF
jgi:hypothetical protein